jgi:hypothetical protein
MVETDFQDWIASLGLDEPDEGGDIGTAPAGRDEFFAEVFKSNGGPLSVEELNAAWQERERSLVVRGAALVAADLRRTTALDPRIEVATVDDGIVAVTYNESYQTPATFAIREPESICDVADNLRDHVVDDLWAVWPVCPKDGLGLDPRPINGRAVWHCRVGDHIVSEIGQLPRADR